MRGGKSPKQGAALRKVWLVLWTEAILEGLVHYETGSTLLGLCCGFKEAE